MRRNHLVGILVAGALAFGVQLGAAQYGGSDATQKAPAAKTKQQAIDLIKSVRFGPNSVEQQVNWLCHLLDGKESGGKPYQPHECQWQATKINSSIWRVEYTDRSVALDGSPIAADKIWLLDAANLEIQPRTIATLMITAPELSGVSTEKEIDIKFIALTGRPFQKQVSHLNQEIDILPRWRVERDGILSRR